MGKWEMVRLGDVIAVTSGGTPKKDVKEYYENGTILWVKTGDLKTQYINNTESSITELALQNSSAKIFPIGTVLVAMYGATIGACSILNVKASTNQACAALLPTSEILSTYIYYYFCLIKEKLIALGVGGAQPNISGNIIKNLSFPLPPLDVQQKIADVLDKASTLIELRRAQLDKLDLLIKSQFIEMFGDSITIAKRWPTFALDECYEIIDGDRGKNYPRDFSNEGYCLFLNADNVTKNGFSFVKNQFITKEKDEQLRKGSLKREDIVLTTRGTIGNLAYYDSAVPYEHIRINSGMVLLRHKKQIAPQYFLTYFTPEVFKDYKSGTAQPQMPISSMKKIPIPMPSLTLQNQFVSFVQQVDKSKFAIQQSLSQLERNYKSLMQKCFRGEIF